jgi:opacity protein-like surface antigen
MLRTGINLLAAISLLAAWPAAPLRAQDRVEGTFGYRVEAFGDFAGVHVMNFQVSNKRNGSGFGAGFGFRPFRTPVRGLGFEIRTSRIASDSVPGEGAAQDYERWHAWLVAASVVYHFRAASRVQPFVHAGFGYMNAGGTYLCSTCIWNPDPVTRAKIYIQDRRTASGSDHGPMFGAGLKIAITRHVFVRAEFSELVTTQGTRWDWEHSSIGMGVRF